MTAAAEMFVPAVAPEISGLSTWPHLHGVPDGAAPFADELKSELVIALPSLPEDELAVKRAERLARQAGALMVRHTAETITEPAYEAARPQRYTTLAAAIEGAAWGDAEARQLIRANVRADVVERTIKAGHVMSNTLEVDENGQLLQYGQTLEAVHFNGLRYAAANEPMNARAKAEARNSFRMQQAYLAGQLAEHYFVVFSRYADDMPDAAAAEAGFFVDTKSCAIQVTTQHGDQLVQEAAFVAGVKNRGDKQHDQVTVQLVAEGLGVPLTGKTATEIIDTPLLVHKSLLPQGVLSLVERYDTAAGGTFFGEDKPVQNYRAFYTHCRQRESAWSPIVEKITDQLVAAYPQIQQNPVEAIKLLATYSQREMVNYAATDDTIDARVFGETAAAYVEEARVHYRNNDFERFETARSNAQDTARSSSCPTVLGSATGNQAAGESAGGEDGGESGDCTFVSKQCPKCGKKNVFTRVTKHRISGSCGCSVRKH